MPAYDGKYVTNADVRNEGVTTTDASDATVDLAIQEAERDFEMWTGRWFYRQANVTLQLDGGFKYFPFAGFVETTDLLLLPIPVIALTAVSIFGYAYDITSFIAFSRIGPPRDDRWNPRIISKLYNWPLEGVQNISLTGDFGFVEETTNYTTPLRVKVAVRKLAIRYCNIKKMGVATASEREMDRNQTYIDSEQLPGYKYQMKKNWRPKADIIWYSGDAEVDEVVEYYRYKRYHVSVQ